VALKTEVATLEGLPEALHEHYVAEGDKFVLAHDGNDRIKEFRDNNINLKQQTEDLTAKLKGFDGIDPEKYLALTELERQKRDKELIDKGDLETLLSERLDNVKTTYQTQLDAIKTELDKTRGELVATKVTDTLKTAAANAGVRPEAMSDVVSLASSNWELRDGTPTFIQNGEVVLSKDNVGEPIGMPEYFKSMLHEKPFYFQTSAGSGGGSQYNPRGVRVIPNDPVSIGLNADQIAKGEAVIEGA
jgi:hypothetical protein